MEFWKGDNGQQSGDPAKLAQALITTAARREGGQPPQTSVRDMGLSVRSPVLPIAGRNSGPWRSPRRPAVAHVYLVSLHLLSSFFRNPGQLRAGGRLRRQHAKCPAESCAHSISTMSAVDLNPQSTVKAN